MHDAGAAVAGSTGVWDRFDSSRETAVSEPGKVSGGVLRQRREIPES